MLSPCLSHLLLVGAHTELVFVHRERMAEDTAAGDHNHQCIINLFIYFIRTFVFVLYTQMVILPL